MADRILHSTDAKDPLYRLRVQDDADWDLVTLLEEDVTSSRPTAQVTNVRAALDLTTEQARWVIRALTEVLEERAARHAEQHGCTTCSGVGLVGTGHYGDTAPCPTCRPAEARRCVP